MLFILRQGFCHVSANSPFQKQQQIVVETRGRVFEQVNRAVETYHMARDLQNGGSVNSTQEFCSLCLTGGVFDRNPLAGTAADQNLTCADYAWITSTIPLNDSGCAGIRQLYPFCCESAPSPMICESRVRSKILANYDTMSAPRLSHIAPLDISMSLSIYLVTALDVQAGTAEVFVWLTLLWNDPRLQWEANEQDCATSVTVRASLDSQKTEIWVPDIDIYNLDTGVQNMPDATAEVFADGTVLWSRNGPIKAICQFTGLSRIPFDTMGCQFLFGPWVRKGVGYFNYTLDGNTGFSLEDFTSTYSEFRLDQERTEAGVAANEAGIVFFNLFFHRATRFYVNNIIIPTAMLTYLSFGSFLLDIRVGERLSFGIAMALVVVAQQIVTSGLLPISNERLWIDRFITLSFYWIVFSLAQTVLIAYFFFLHDSSKQPPASDAEKRKPEALETVAEEPLEEQEAQSDNEQPDNEQRPSMKKENSVFFKHQENFQTFKKLLLHKEKSPAKLRLLRRFDRFCFFVTFGSYTIFIIAMFASLGLWKDKVLNNWLT